jgi:ApaG protein
MNAADSPIEITVETRFVGEHSDPSEHRYSYAYTITIRNRGRRTAQLLTRHWIITDANGRVQEVQGDGVVGEQPTLAPGEAFRYTSGCVLETPVGVMHGSYGMVDADGRRFTAPIAPFRLAVPGLVH